MIRTRLGPILTWLVLAGPAVAQFPRHTLTSIYPAGGQSGTNVSVEIGGTELDGPIALAFDHPGLRAFRLKGPKFVVSIAPGVPPGWHDVRIDGPFGVSNPRSFVVGDRPETREVEPNNKPETAQAIEFGSVVQGRFDAVPDVDTFAIVGKRGQSLVVEIATASIDTKADAAYRLISPSGRELVSPSETPGPEPTLALRLPEDGRYMLQVHDLVYAGSADHGYRLTVREGPWLAAIEPVPGSSGMRSLIGRALQPGGTALLDREWESLLSPMVPCPAPAVGSGLALARGGWFVTPGPRLSNRAFLSEPRERLISESEPNDRVAQAQSLAPPCEVVSSFDKPGDLDRFRFHAEAGQKWVVEVVADRAGIPIDAEFVVRQFLDDGTTREILFGDDQADPFAGKRFPVGTLDPRGLFTAAADGEYEIAVHDSNGSIRSDLPLLYRLLVRPERPDFDLILVPSDEANPEGTTLRAGGRASCYVLARRIDGLSSPIRVEAVELPPGVSCDPVVIGTNQTMAPIVFSCEPDAKPSLGRVRVAGRSLSGDRKEILDFTRGQTLFGERSHDAISGTLVWPTAAGGNQPPIAQARASTEFSLAIREGAPFRLTVKPDSAVVGVGESIELTVELERRAGFTEGVQITAADLPPNVPAPAAVSIAKDKTSAMVKVTIPKEASPGLYPLLLRGSGPFPFRKDPNAKEAANITVNEPANVVTLTIRK